MIAEDVLGEDLEVVGHAGALVLVVLTARQVHLVNPVAGVLDVDQEILGSDIFYGNLRTILLFS